MNPNPLVPMNAQNTTRRTTHDLLTRFLSRCARLFGVAVVGALAYNSRLDGASAVSGPDLISEIEHAPVVFLPLGWAGDTPPGDEENRALLDQIKQVNPGGRGPTLQLLGQFILTHPDSPWVPALRANLGVYDYQHGRYTEALQHLEAAWEATKREQAGAGKKIADFSFTYWTRLLSSLGRLEKLTALYQETQGRVFDRGPLQHVVNASKEGYHLLLTEPGNGFKCGTFALWNVGRALKGAAFDGKEIMDLPSPKSGFTMTKLVELSDRAGLDLVPVEWGQHKTLVVPSVVHWKQNHYAAILEEKHGYYRVMDPTFGRARRWLKGEDIQAEASGYFVVPRDRVPAGWIRLAKQQTDTIFGKGLAYGIDDGTDGCGNSSGGGTGGLGGVGGGGGGIPAGGGAGGGGGGPVPKAASGANPVCTGCNGGGGGSGGSSGSTGGDGSSCSTKCPGMPVWEVSEPYINLWLYDEPVGYQPGIGQRMSFKLAYNQRDGREYWTSRFFMLGTHWNCSWLSYIIDEPPGDAYMTVAGGGERSYDLDATGPEYYSQTRVERLTDGFGNLTGFIVSYPNGAKDYYSYVTSGEWAQTAFLTEKVDAVGHTNRFIYGGTGADVILTNVVDAEGFTNTLTYTNGSYRYQITGVDDRFGRHTTLQYDDKGRLTNVTDVAGLSSSFQYDENGWVTNLTTPYGTTVFEHTDLNNPNYWDFHVVTGTKEEYTLIRALKVRDAAGGTNVYMLRQNSARIYTTDTDYVLFVPTNYDASVIPSGVPTTTLDTNYMNYRNSFHWGPKQASGLPANFGDYLPADYRKARMRHWLHEGHEGSPGGTWISQTLEMEQAPSPDGVVNGQTTWFDYDGKLGPGYEGYEGTNYTQPSLIARVLPDGTTWYTWYRRDEWGRATNVVDTYSSGFGQTPLTRTNAYEYDANGDLVKHVGPTGNVDDGYAYDSNHQLIYYTNAMQEVTVFTYDAQNRLTSVRTPAGLTTTNIYFATGDYTNWVKTTIDLEINRTNSYDYGNGLVTTHTDERGLTMANTWDDLQRLRRVDYPDGTFITNSYDKLDLVRTIDRKGFTNSFTYDAVRRKTSQTDANGRTMYFNYCTCGALDSLEDAAGQFTYLFYDNAGRMTNVVYPDLYSVTNGFDALGELIWTMDSGGCGETNWFVNQGLRYTTWNAAGQVSLLQFDIKDRPVYVTDANGVMLTNTYDAANRLLSRGYPDGGVESFGYTINSGAGFQPASYTNQLGYATHYGYDAASRKIAETNANGEIIRYTNSAAGDLLSLTDGKLQTTKWNYDEYGRVTNKVDQAGAEILRYTYDADSRLASRWSAAKGTTFYTNDPVGNLTVINYPTSPDVTFQYDAMNRVTNMVDAAGTTKYSYTAAGQLLTEDGPFDSDTVTNIYNQRLRTGLILEQPTDVWWTSFGYDAARRLTSVASPAGTFGYSFGGHASRLTQKLSLPNSSYITNTYDEVARLLSTKLLTAGSAILDAASYVYNAGNQRTRQTFADASTVDYTYDPIGQLTVADSSVNSEDRDYTYDAAWNLNHRTRNGTSDTFTVNGKNELTSEPAGSCTYDANGNLTADAAKVLVYDDENRLVEWRQGSSPGSGVLASTFVYDGQGRLRTRGEYQGNGSSWVLQWVVNYFYDGMRVIEERDGNNYPQVAYTRGTDLSGTLAGAGGIGGLLARSQDFTNCSSTITYWLTNNSGYCLYDLAIWDDYDTYVSGASVNEWETGQFSFAGVAGRMYYVFGWSCDYYNIQLYYDGFSGTRDTHTVNFVGEGDWNCAPGANCASESGNPLCGPDQTGVWLTHNYYHGDGNGNVTALESSAQTLTASYRYDPFGNITSQSGGLADANVYRFSSKEFHAASAMYYYGYRWYAPGLQRWLNRDPILENGGYNLYEFEGNEPMDFVDLAGLKKDPSCVAWCNQNYHLNLGLGDLLGGLWGIGTTKPDPGRVGRIIKNGGGLTKFGDACVKTGIGIVITTAAANVGEDGGVALLGCLSGCPDVPDDCPPKKAPWGQSPSNCNANNIPVLNFGPPTPPWNFPSPHGR